MKNCEQETHCSDWSKNSLRFLLFLYTKWSGIRVQSWVFFSFFQIQQRARHEDVFHRYLIIISNLVVLLKWSKRFIKTRMVHIPEHQAALCTWCAASVLGSWRVTVPYCTVDRCGFCVFEATKLFFPTLIAIFLWQLQTPVATWATVTKRNIQISVLLSAQTSFDYVVKMRKLILYCVES